MDGWIRKSTDDLISFSCLAGCNSEEIRRSEWMEQELDWVIKKSSEDDTNEMSTAAKKKEVHFTLRLAVLPLKSQTPEFFRASATLGYKDSQILQRCRFGSKKKKKKSISGIWEIPDCLEWEPCLLFWCFSLFWLHRVVAKMDTT